MTGIGVGEGRGEGHVGFHRPPSVRLHANGLMSRGVMRLCCTHRCRACCRTHGVKLVIHTLMPCLLPPRWRQAPRTDTQYGGQCSSTMPE